MRISFFAHISRLSNANCRLKLGCCEGAVWIWTATTTTTTITFRFWLTDLFFLRFPLGLPKARRFYRPGALPPVTEPTVSKHCFDSDFSCEVAFCRTCLSDNEKENNKSGMILAAPGCTRTRYAGDVKTTTDRGRSIATRGYGRRRACDTPSRRDPCSADARWCRSLLDRHTTDTNRVQVECANSGLTNYLRRPRQGFFQLILEMGSVTQALKKMGNATMCNLSTEFCESRLISFCAILLTSKLISTN